MDTRDERIEHELAQAAIAVQAFAMRYSDKLATLEGAVAANAALIEEIRAKWHLRIDAAAKAAGEAQAEAFGARLTAGLERNLQEVTARAERVSRALGWRTAFILSAGIAGGIALTIGLALWMLTPTVRGLSAFEVQMALFHLQPCNVNGADHVCAEVDSAAQLVTGRHGALLVPIKGT